MIGTRGHDAGGMMSPTMLAETLANQGFEAVQLVAYRSVEGIGEKSDEVAGPLAAETGMALRNAGIHVALIGSYFNLLDPREEVVAEGIARFKAYLKHAGDFGGSLVGTETGSFNMDYSFHPENRSQEAFDRVVAIVKELAQEAEDSGVMVGIESVWSHSIATPKRMKALLEAVDSDYVKVIFDPVNLLNQGNHEEAQQLMEEAFGFYGDRIAVIHAKDFVVESGGLKSVPLGQGLMDYGRLLKLRAEYCPDAGVIIEELTGKDLAASREFLVREMSEL